MTIIDDTIVLHGTDSVEIMMPSMVECLVDAALTDGQEFMLMPNKNDGKVGTDTSFDVLLKCLDANKEDTSLC